MYLVAIAWMYVVVMMAVAEATSTMGTVLGATFTFLLYGVMPLSIVLYLMGTPGRKKRRLKLEAAEAAATVELGLAPTTPAGSPSAQAATVAHPVAAGARLSTSAAGGSGLQPDGSRMPAGDSVAPERKEP